MRKLKVGYLVASFYPFGDGMENYCLDSVRELVKMGHEVHVFTSDRKDGKIIEKMEEVYQGIHIHRSRTFWRYRHYLDFCPGVLLDFLKCKDLDVLHVHSFGFIFYDLAVLYSKLFRRQTALVNTPYGPFMCLKDYPWWQEVLKWCFKKVEYPLNTFYDGAIQINPQQWKWIVDEGVKKEKVFLSIVGISNNTYDKVDNKDFIEKYNLKGKLVISNLNRVMEYKGQHQIIQVLPDIVKEYPNVVFLSMGREKDGWIKHCKDLAKKLGVEKNVIIVGEVSEEDKLKGLDASEIFVQSSKWEAFGIVTLEAMARKNAIVSTDNEGSKFLVEKNGLLYKWEDLDGLKSNLLKLIKDKKLREEMKEESYKRSFKFTNEAAVRDYLEPVYQKLRLRK